MVLSIVGLIGGLFILVKSADYLVSGASSIAKKLGVSSLVIGLTVVAFGTSAPELFVNIFSALSGSTAIAVGNVMGSNLANVMLILGLAAAVKPLRVQTSTVSREIPLMLLASVMVLIMASDVFLDGMPANMLSRTNGLALLGFFLVFLYYTYSMAKAGAGSQDKVKVYKPWLAAVMVVGGLFGLVIGGDLIVSGATNIALALGLSEGLIGLTIVAVGTSLPEFATSIAAVRKGQVDLAVGNVVGSNIFNIFFILGTTSVLAPLPFSATNMVDAVIVIATTLLLFASLYVGKRHVVQRWQGITFVILYLVYITYSVLIDKCGSGLCV